MTNQIYSQGFGSVPSSRLGLNPVISSLNPTVNSIEGPGGFYPIGQKWINSSNGTTYTLTSFTTSNGVILANWIYEVGGSATFKQITTQSGTALPLAGAVNIAGTSGVSTVASGNKITISALDNLLSEFVANSGTAVPSGEVLNISGTTNQFSTSANNNTLTIKLADTVDIETLNISEQAVIQGAVGFSDAGGMMTFINSEAIGRIVLTGTNTVVNTSLAEGLSGMVVLISRLILSNPGSLTVSSSVVGQSFTITSTNVLDNCTVNWLLIKASV